MARRSQELLHPAQDRLRDPVRDGRGEAGARITGLGLVDRLECSDCGYGIARSTPPERCPMCHSVDAWVAMPWRPFSMLS
jgi:rubrerythrin